MERFGSNLLARFLQPVWLTAAVVALVPLVGQPSTCWAQKAGPAAAVEPAVELQQRGSFEFEGDGVEISNDFPGGAFSAVRRVEPNHYELTIAPENTPINRSPWYAFKITADEQKTVTVTLAYAHGRHRYPPKISRDGRHFAPIDEERYQSDNERGTAELVIDIGPEATWVAAQELFTSKDYERWMNRLAEHDAVDLQPIGQSPGGRTLSLMVIGDDAAQPESTEGDSRYVLVFGRQHPPELSGGVAMRAFVERLAGDTELARRFRQAFTVLAVPLINPDGVDHGFWRHNFGGKDLNRDWGPFSQPETRHVRDAIDEHLSESSGRVFVGIDFHSTFNNVFYTPSDAAQVELESFVDDWLTAIRSEHPDVDLPESDSHNPSGTTSKTWFVERFAAPGITYEVGDNFDRGTARAVARTAAEAMMRLLLAEVRQTQAADVPAEAVDAAQ